ncbi:hypothetical protein ACFFMM_20585 [Micromonospora chaiyaphumensis]|uniref:hypothetical protein n=1 Tax=Micromonospora chaiyaphumensis TaxID=307119 RepID=UPI0011131281|nr:hypothetical protein [Micromonospora chaiyaphumensis]
MSEIERPEQLARQLVQAASHEEPPRVLEAIATEHLRAGVSREALLDVCAVARQLCEDEPAEEHILDLMDRLSGWCAPSARL